MRFSCFYNGDSLVINAVCHYNVSITQNSDNHAVFWHSWPVLTVGIMHNNVLNLWGFCGDFCKIKKPSFKTALFFAVLLSVLA